MGFSSQSWFAAHVHWWKKEDTQILEKFQNQMEHSKKATVLLKQSSTH